MLFMYESTLDLTTLRQGDVVRDFCFPRYSFPKVRLLYSLGGEQPPQFDGQAVLLAKHQYAVVLSQCCEFNEGKRNAFSLGLVKSLRELLTPELTVCGVNLAALWPLSKSPLRMHTVEEIRKANKLDLRGGANKAVNVYFLEPDGNYLQEPHIVDFSQVISIRMEDKNVVLKTKVLQMTDDNRRQFQQKLAYFYGRRAKS